MVSWFEILLPLSLLIPLCYFTHERFRVDKLHLRRAQPVDLHDLTEFAFLFSYIYCSNKPCNVALLCGVGIIEKLISEHLKTVMYFIQ